MPRRLYANENPQKHKAPGHGSVERAKGDMWTTSSSSSTSSTTTTPSIAAPKNYKVKKYVVAKDIGSGGGIMSTLGIGRGGGGGVMKKKKKKQVEKTTTTSTTTKTTATTKSPSSSTTGVGVGQERANPDADFFH